MLLKNLGRAVLATVALTPFSAVADNKDNPSGQSTFISPDSTLGFALTVPDHDNNDVYFTLRVAKKNSWGAIGLGSDNMRGALILMLYLNEKGDNVTFSPRVAFGNYEPQYYEALNYEILNGTGVFGDDMIFTARCIEHCRSWTAGGTSGGVLDTSDPNQKGIYALGPSEGFQSDKKDAGIKFHKEFGSFTIDVKRTMGQADAPVLTKDSKSDGTTLDSRNTGKSDVTSALHGAAMVFFIVVMMPLGVVVLRFGKWARWHGVNQGVALLGVLAGFAMGIVTSFKYQRSRSFNSYHQVIGYIVVAFLLGQFSLGFLHHQQYKRTQSPTKYGRIHLWLGRVTIFIGTLNAFFGFSFALNRKLGAVIAGVLIFLAFAALAISIGQQYFLSKKRGYGHNPLAGNSQSYPPQQPWRESGGPSNSSPYPDEPPPGYEAPSAQIGLRSVSPWRPGGEGKDDDDEPGLGGTAQRPREFA